MRATKPYFINWAIIRSVLIDVYHPFWLNDNERMEKYWPCSDKSQFWPQMDCSEKELK